MTTIHSARIHAGATRFERALLDIANGLEHIATTRVERRRTRASSSSAAQSAATAERTTARALGGLGILPR